MAASNPLQRTDLPAPDLAELGVVGPRGEAPTRRVMSVSPAGVTVARESPAGPASSQTMADAVRVGGFDMPGEQGAVVIEQAREARRSLISAIDASTGATMEARKASTQLQDRLRVGAKMLQVFSAQIERMERELAGMAERETALRSLVRDAEQRVSDAVRNGLIQLQQAEAAESDVSDKTNVAGRGDQIEALTEMMRQLADRLDRVLGASGQSIGRLGPGDLRSSKPVEIVTTRGMKVHKG